MAGGGQVGERCVAAYVSQLGFLEVLIIQSITVYFHFNAKYATTKKSNITLGNLTLKVALVQR